MLQSAVTLTQMHAEVRYAGREILVPGECSSANHGQPRPASWYAKPNHV